MKAIDIEEESKKLLNKGYVRRLAPDETGGYVASILEFPGCVAEGETADEALTHLNNAAEAWIEVALAHGHQIREPINFEGFSGKIALRMPRTLHKQAAEIAELEGCSLNQLLVTAIAHFVGGKQLVSHLEALTRPMQVNNVFVGHVSFIATAQTSAPTLTKTYANIIPMKNVTTCKAVSDKSLNLNDINIKGEIIWPKLPN
jgi:predicted RNase H-like HicB family nuclease